jgi:6-phosphogluconolactonase
VSATDSPGQQAPLGASSGPDAKLPSASVAPAADANVAAATLPLLFVGSGDWGTATGAVSVYRFDSSSGALALQHRTEAGGLLSFLASDAKRQFLYAADEEQKLLRSFAINPTSGALTPIATRATDSGPVFVRVTQGDSHILAAQFSGGKTEVFPLDAAGGFGERSSVAASGAESHSVYLSPDERFAFVPGRGSDRITQFTFSAPTGKLAAHGFTAEPKGAGCRHMAFDTAGAHAYLVNEFHNTISVFDYTASSGNLKKTQSVSTLPQNFAGKSSAADVHLHPNGRFLYATNRPAQENGSVVAYRIEANGTLSLIEHESTLGRVPRNFVMSADGSRLVVGNQESKSIVIFSVDSETGGLTKLNEVALDVKPFFVSFL